MPTRRRSPVSAGVSDAPKARRCNMCGRELPEFSRESVSARLRQLLADAGRVRPYNPKETDAQRAERSAEWYSSAHAVMRVGIAIMADDADGICVFCSKGGLENEHAAKRFESGQRVVWKGVAGVVVREGEGSAAHDGQRLLIRHPDGEAWAWASELEFSAE